MLPPGECTNPWGVNCRVDMSLTAPPASFDDVWGDITAIVGPGLSVRTLGNDAENYVKAAGGESIHVTTRAGEGEINKSVFRDGWNQLTATGILPQRQTMGTAQFRSAAVFAVLDLLPYVDHCRHPLTLFLVSHAFRNEELSSTFGVGANGGIRYNGPALKPTKIVFITDDDSHGDHPYRDRWDGKTLWYTGEGLTGDQTMSRGNLALQSAIATNVPVYGFRRVEPHNCRYMGRFVVMQVRSEQQPDMAGRARSVYLFEMRQRPSVCRDRGGRFHLPGHPDAPSRLRTQVAGDLRG